MSSPKLELAKRHNPALASLIDQLMSYISDQVGGGQTFILPKLAAAALNINDGEAYVLLRILVGSGVLKQQYNVYCGPQGMLLASVDSADDLDQVPYCDFCDTHHEPKELSLEIAFRLNRRPGETGVAA